MRWDVEARVALAADPLVEAGSLHGLAQAFDAGQSTAEQVTRAYLGRIAALDASIGAFEYVDAAGALDQARSIDARRRAGETLGPLAGMPVALKDNFFVAGMPIRAGSNVPIDDLLPVNEGPFVARLRALGCVILGKTRTVEFALGITGQSMPRGTPRNPADARTVRTTGGSSSGSAAALAAGLCALAFGTDTGGSVRVPAALCGLVGLKTGTGQWSIEGILPLAPHLDTVGLFARSARDASLAYATIEGSCMAAPRTRTLNGTVLGVPRDYFFRNLDSRVETATAIALDKLVAAGATLRDVEAADLAAGRDTYFPLVLPAQLIALLGRDRFATHRDRMDPVVAARGERGLAVSEADLEDAKARRAFDVNSIAARFDTVHAWVMPTATAVAPSIDDLRDPARNWALTMGLTQNSQPINYLDMCAVSVPLITDGRLPVGLQIAAPKGSEARLLAVAEAIETCIGRPAAIDMRPFQRPDSQSQQGTQQ
ncbi:amidase [Chitinasiproducens palmae]|uniref:Aspartyl-tRNA(Asn)/glutamyl-tRNA(Gln) amidotransferase subunit A n=1 Tax=Chitinasiproducens palmae TaxID=1770053 RepID=A0A1H2PT29_9BURK|nr:amidase [Chitinasiproducens palmae]SDV50252.1 aspartyl-tRNA(Asn)/glutamyl-tRNA(Gln) amidotransferase subunit A [Chitinasiproducens palmae]